MAEIYADGQCEEVVGEAVKPYDREDLFITKVWRSHLRFNDILSSIKGSLRPLDLDYVDLYLVHWPNPEVPLKETMRAMELCAEEGYTRFMGSATSIEISSSHEGPILSGGASWRIRLSIIF